VLICLKIGNVYFGEWIELRALYTYGLCLFTGLMVNAFYVIHMKLMPEKLAFVSLESTVAISGMAS